MEIKKPKHFNLIFNFKSALKIELIFKNVKTMILSLSRWINLFLFVIGLFLIIFVESDLAILIRI